MSENPGRKVQMNDAEYEVWLKPDGASLVQVICTRRDTGLTHNRTIKPGSANWKRAVRLATSGGN